ncbi:MAG TPA: RIP metalloprotease RseP [Terriglobales bacterium]|nr:RIP metalloprotease RseP [Terriglobales bacterium]
MSEFFTAVIAVAVVLGFMILIHELGHYAAAKLVGVRVEVFSIGFGKRLFGFRRGDTDYRVSALPLGGYVKMSGENPMDERTGDPAEFMSHPRWHRFIIAIAGPAMNILLAIALLTGVYMVKYEYPVYLDQPVLLAWVKQGSPAANAGLRAGDKIIRVDGVDDPTWEQLEPKIWLSPDQPVKVTAQRGNETFETTVTPKPITSSEVGWTGWYPESPVTVGVLEPGMPAAKAGIKQGDRVIAIDGKPVPHIEAMIEELQQTKSQPVTLTILRDGKEFDVGLTPVLANTDDPSEKRYRIGFGNQLDTKVSRLPFAAALDRSLSDNKKYSMLILELMKKLVQRKVSIRTISGPIGIAQDAGEAAEAKGWTPLLTLTAAISLNLGIFNLLPIPILDGGVILLLLIEGFMRRDISIRIKERIYQAAFVFLVLFAVMVIYNDLAKTLPGLAGRF